MNIKKAKDEIRHTVQAWEIMRFLWSDRDRFF